MKKCLKITFAATDLPKDFLRAVIQKNARKLELEGVAQVMNNNDKVKIIVSGLKDSVDKFLDVLHKQTARVILEDIEIEPFVKDKDYRNVFRVIE